MMWIPPRAFASQNCFWICATNNRTDDVRMRWENRVGQQWRHDASTHAVRCCCAYSIMAICWASMWRRPMTVCPTAIPNWGHMFLGLLRMNLRETERERQSLLAFLSLLLWISFVCWYDTYCNSSAIQSAVVHAVVIWYPPMPGPIRIATVFSRPSLLSSRWSLAGHRKLWMHCVRCFRWAASVRAHGREFWMLALPGIYCRRLASRRTIKLKVGEISNFVWIDCEMCVCGV